MSLVVFPFKREDPEALIDNIRVAAEHPRVSQVLAVGFDEDACFHSLVEGVPAVERDTRTSVNVIPQERLGVLRPGKGDGMNTGLRYFLGSTEAERLHFYDADLLSFTPDWITKAEEAADHGYEVVRHYFPRASTDAMITWFITRTGFAMLWPRSELPRIEQPLGGELLFTRPVAEALLADTRVQAQSDWGIDTLYTFATVAGGFRMYEAYIGAGKIHRLYGALTDLRTMLIECFSAVQNLHKEEVFDVSVHHVEYQGPVSEAVKSKIGYQFDDTLALLGEGWTERQLALLDAFPVQVREGMASSRTFPQLGFMSDEAWYDSYQVLLREFRADDHDWQELIFKLWIARVLTYTVTVALRGYDVAMHHLHQMVENYTRRAAGSA